MAKIVKETHITGEKGVVKFNSFCVNHTPYLIWREEAKNDFGIDGEVELTRKTENGKTEATANVLKVQIKSTKTGSYIGNEDKNSFEFIAKDHDINYWRSHHLPVILVVYFEKTNKLYAKTVDKNEALIGNKKSHRILFDKNKNELVENVTDFTSAIGQEFIDRVGENISEMIFTNLFEVTLPKFIYQFKCKYKKAQKIFDTINEEGILFPQFSLVSDQLYTFSPLDAYSDTLLGKILVEKTGKRIDIKEFVLGEKENQKNVVRIVNSYLKNFLYRKGIRYNKEFRRFHFSKRNEDPLSVKESENKKVEVFEKVKYRGKSNRSDTRSVVSKYTYYEESFFYRHLGFQVYYKWFDSDLYLVLEPKYYFSQNGIDPLDNPKRITRLTNQIKITERNQHYLNHVFFFQNYFTHQGKIELSNELKFPVGLMRMKKYDVGFGIKNDTRKNYTNTDDLPDQLSLF
ncbi:MAG: DUF4365 domain-containing protein [Flavobacteriales bacterium]|nr:DUF4365 domain-containing protein [Flavobacteriales bacterium]